MTSNDPAMARVLERLKAHLLQAWCAQTAYKGLWDAANPALNQCAVTALAVESCLGGEIIQGVAVTPNGERISHYWNRIGDADQTFVDLTASQFPEGTLFQRASTPRIGDHKTVSDYLLASTDTAARYALLMSRLAVPLPVAA